MQCKCKNLNWRSQIKLTQLDYPYLWSPSCERSCTLDRYLSDICSMASLQIPIWNNKMTIFVSWYQSDLVYIFEVDNLFDGHVGVFQEDTSGFMEIWGSTTLMDTFSNTVRRSMLIILKPINFVTSGRDLLSTSTAQLHSSSAAGMLWSCDGAFDCL